MTEHALHQLTTNKQAPAHAFAALRIWPDGWRDTLGVAGAMGELLALGELDLTALPREMRVNTLAARYGSASRTSQPSG